jgi:hypothetical protein
MKKFEIYANKYCDVKNILAQTYLKSNLIQEGLNELQKADKVFQNIKPIKYYTELNLGSFHRLYYLLNKVK